MNKKFVNAAWLTEGLKNKIFKYSKMAIVLLMVGALVGIYFVQSQQFAANSSSNTHNQLLDLLVLTMPRSLNWLAVVLFAIGWILWEFAISKMGNKKMAIAAMVIIGISTFFAMNLLTYVFGLTAVIAMIALTVIYIPSISERSASKMVNNNIKANTSFNQRFKELLSFKKSKKQLR